MHHTTNPNYWNAQNNQCIKQPIPTIGTHRIINASNNQSQLLERTELSMHKKTNPNYWNAQNNQCIKQPIPTIGTHRIKNA
jgi:hypothetical protein